MLVADFDVLLDHFSDAGEFHVITYQNRYTRLFIEGHVFLLTLQQRVMINSFLSFVGPLNWSQYQDFDVVNSWCITTSDFKYVVGQHQKQSDSLLAKQGWFYDEDMRYYQSLYPLRLAYYLQAANTPYSNTFEVPTKVWKFTLHGNTIGNVKAIATCDLKGNPISGIITFKYLLAPYRTEVTIWFPKPVAGHVMYLKMW